MRPDHRDSRFPRPPLRSPLIFLLLLLIGAARPAAAEDGQWIELEPLDKDVRIGPLEPVAPSVSKTATVVSESSENVADGQWFEISPEKEARAAEQPPVDLPRRFFWQGRVRELGRVGYVYLGDYYFVEEREYAKAEKAYRHALESWPQSGPILTRLDLLGAVEGDWLMSAEAMQVSLDEGLPPAVRHEYGLDENSPLLSNTESDLPYVPAILFRLALQNLPSVDEVPGLEAPWAFLRGRLLSHLGEYDEALRALAPVAVDEAAAPWNFQAASQRGELYLATWRPELAYVNLLQARRLVGDHPGLVARIDALRDGLALKVMEGDGPVAQEVVRILGRQDRGRWILSPPETAFAGRVDVAHIEGESLAPGEGTKTQLVYRGEDYWLLTLPLGSPEPDWKDGQKLTLLGTAAGG